MKAIVNGKILINGEAILGKALIFDEKIHSIVDEKEIDKGIQIIDAKGNYVSPGFINIHIHGIGGFDTMDEDGIQNMSLELVKTGVTSFLASTVTSDYTTLEKLFAKLPEESNICGAKFLGIHLEGPYISKGKLGAHKEAYLKKPDIDFILKHKKNIKMLTYAPEEDSNNEFLKFLVDETNIIPAIGHTDGDKDIILKAVKGGCKIFTHLFNAMTGIHHRKPGAVSVALIENTYIELISDNIHVDPYLYNLVSKMKSRERIILISDSMKAANLIDGSYKLGELDVKVRDGRATLSDGTLAGSIMTLNKGLLNFVNNSNYSIEEAIDFVTSNPAKLLNLDKLGKLQAGYDSDINIFDDNINIKEVYVKGKKVY